MKLPDAQPLLIVGLGNPGEQYKYTRHNMGFLVVEAFAARANCLLKEVKQFQALAGKTLIKGRTAHLLLPLTYMNLSGEALKRYLSFFKLSDVQVIIVTDDVAFPYGQLRLKTMGSAGGHNGLKSIEAALGTSHYTRLKMGIGSPGPQVLSDYVLDVFSSVEKETLPEFIDKGVVVLQRLIVESVSNVMNAVNTVPRQNLKKELKAEPKDLITPPMQGLGEHE